MKRPCSSDSLGALMSMCPNTTDEQNHMYSTRDFQSMLLDEEGCIEESGHVSEKKRRLSVEQVKALEKNFEVENKLEPERKVKLAQELGLQPRQVAVWFQNRRARWKTKQLERDYGVLKANFDALKHNYESLKHDNEALLKEIRELKSKVYTENEENRGVAVKEEAMESESDDNKLIEQSKPNDNDINNNNLLENFEEEDEEEEINFENFNVAAAAAAAASTNIFGDHFKDGSSDSDSSAILNEDSSPNAAAISSSGAFLISTNGNGSGSSKSSTSLNLCFQFTESSSSKSNLGDGQKVNNYYQPQQYVKMEEHNFFNGEESCSTLFTDEQAPTLQWYCPEDWNWKES